jgi:ribose-phosphate pyrophosphokinase
MAERLLDYNRTCEYRHQLTTRVSTKYVVQLFEACGADAVMTLDVHNLAAFENAFRCPSTNLEAIQLFIAHFVRLLGHEKVAVVSPDIGGAKRAEQFRRALAAELHDEPAAAFVEKRRSGGASPASFRSAKCATAPRSSSMI